MPRKYSLTRLAIGAGLAAALFAIAQARPAEPAARLLEVDGESWSATELVRETFADAAWRNRWIVEGDAACEARDGRLNVVTSDQPGSKRAATLWWHETLPADVLIEMTAGADLPAEENAANLNLIFHAREPDGRPYQFGRSSAYAEYHKIPNYIITLTGGFQEGWSRVRRDPGFSILSEEKSTRSEPGRTYRIRVLLTGGRIRYWLDGRLIHDARDPQPLPGGHFALRTWRSRVWWSDIRISALQRAAPAPVAATPAKPWFKSGFEAGTELVPDEPARKLDRFAGRDATTGFDWSADLPAKSASFVYIANANPPTDYFRTELRDTAGRAGAPTRALYMEVTKISPARATTGVLNRNEFSLFQPAADQAYTRHWLRLQDNYLEVCPQDDKTSWRMFYEVKEPDSKVARVAGKENRQTGTNNYRISCYIRRTPAGKLYWHVRGESPQPVRKVDWDIFNDEVPVPVGRWFQVEVFFRHAPAPDGLVWLAIDGRQVALHRGNAQHPTNPLPLKFYSPFKLYQSPEWLAAGPVSQWIDDVEFWPDFPPDATARDESRADRSTFTPAIADSPAASSPGPALRPAQ